MTYDKVRCGTCGVPWSEHTEACPRHAHRPRCLGHELPPREIDFKCCDRAGEYNGFASGPLLFTCPESCSCHD